MARCEVCGNDYDKAFQIMTSGETHTFDSFECAIHSLAPTCEHCGCRITGHGIEANDRFYCCAHCARESGITSIRDRQFLVTEQTRGTVMSMETRRGEGKHGPRTTRQACATRPSKAPRAGEKQKPARKGKTSAKMQKSARARNGEPSRPPVPSPKQAHAIRQAPEQEGRRAAASQTLPASTAKKLARHQRGSLPR